MPEPKRINQLPQQIADRIAAGEVVDRPISIVKELVENSIDAGASSIVVEIRNGGKSYIRVTDNGSGIPSADVELAFLRHATSKIRDAADLDAIATLGFRGEALASIAAVSRTELVTKTEAEKTGTYLLIEGGQIAQRSEKGAPTGTTLVVRDLFYNTPARLKFLKNDNVESAQIIDFVSKIALAYPALRVRMINNGNTLFSTPGKGDRFISIATIYDPNMAKKLIRLERQGDGGLALEGYISPTDQTRPNRRSQIFFVNGRYIHSKLLEECVSEAYRARMFEGRFPIAFLFLEVDPALTDVNIHPNKREIRFDDETVIRRFVTEALQQALAIPEAVPEITFKKDRRHVPAEEEAAEERPTAPAREEDSHQEELDIRKLLRNRRAEETRRLQSKAAADVQLHEDAVSYESGAGRAGVSKRKESRVEATASYESGAGQPTESDFAAAGAKAMPSAPGASGEAAAGAIGAAERDAGASGDGPASGLVVGADAQASPAAAAAEEGGRDAAPRRPAREPVLPAVRAAASRPFEVEDLRPVGVIFKEYILCEDGAAFYMIDQHAAHERVFYEQFVEAFYRGETARQVLMTPLTIHTSFAAGILAGDWLEFLQGAGFGAEEFGARTYIIREIPAYMDWKEAEDFLADFTEQVEKAGAFRDPRRVDRIITRACKAAVKANDTLGAAEIEQLLRDLSACKNPFSCPHGRPTIVRMTHAEIDRLFKR